MGEDTRSQAQAEAARFELATQEAQRTDFESRGLLEGFFQNPVIIGDAPPLADELFQGQVATTEPNIQTPIDEPKSVVLVDNQPTELINPSATDSTQPELANATVEVIDDNETIAKIRAILAHPENFQKSDVEDVILDAFAGRSYAQFLTQESIRNPQLVQAVEDLKAFMESAMGRNTQNTLRTAEALGLPAPQQEEELKASDILEVAQEVDEQGEKNLVITKNGKSGPEKITIGTAAALAMFLVADFAFFKGSNMEAIGHRFGSEGATYLLLRMGFDVKLPDALNAESMDKMIGMMEPHKFQHYIEDSTKEETVKFLEKMSTETRQAMLSGKEFGGANNNQHKLEDKTIALIFSRLSAEDMERLEVTKLNPNQPVTDQTPEPVATS